MKKIFILLLIAFSVSFSVKGQRTSAKLDENTIVKDSTGRQYPYSVWKILLNSLDYDLRPANPADKSTGFVIFPLSEEEKIKRLESAPKPPDSKYFTTGRPFGSLKTKDINGNKIDLKEMIGKVVVLNYWFINCPPCQSEIPHLNKLVKEYAADSNIVFIGIALDKKDAIEEFVESIPFDYTIVDSGRSLASDYRITAYPTNVVIDKQGNVAFHTSGYGMATAYWIRKTIEGLK
jgi:thiol-disulfide isomerase/thioredoxin